MERKMLCYLIEARLMAGLHPEPAMSKRVYIRPPKTSLT